MTTTAITFSQEDRMNYFKRAYHTPKKINEHMKNPTEFDLKMLNILPKMYKMYETHNNRRSIISLNDEESRQLLMTTNGKTPLAKEKEDSEIEKITKKVEKIKITSVLCGATKMDGEICGCKVKLGSTFCGRHTPK